jgi:thioredoxin-related protein
MKQLLTLFAAWMAIVQLPLSAAEGTWLTDYENAQKKAKEEKKLLLLDFTGSDWCPPCKLLHKNVFSKKEFLDFAKDHLVLMEIDFPNHKKQSKELEAANKKLAAKYEIEGFPTIIVQDAEGKTLSKEVGYPGLDAKDYVAKLKKLVK